MHERYARTNFITSFVLTPQGRSASCEVGDTVIKKSSLKSTPTYYFKYILKIKLIQLSDPVQSLTLAAKTTLICFF